MEPLQIILLVFAVIGLCYGILGAIRNEMTYHFRVKRSEIIHQFNVNKPIREQYIDYTCPLSYHEMMWDLKKWSYKAFFPKGF